MPLYDCMLMLKPQVDKVNMMELVGRVAKHIYRRNGVITEFRSFGEVNLGYGIKKRDARYYKAKLMQMTMMARPSINEELRYLNKEDRLLRWILVKSRDFNHGFELNEDDDRRYRLQSSLSNLYGDAEDDDDEDDDEDDDDEVEQGDHKERKWQ